MPSRSRCSSSCCCCFSSAIDARARRRAARAARRAGRSSAAGRRPRSPARWPAGPRPPPTASAGSGRRFGAVDRRLHRLHVGERGEHDAGEFGAPRCAQLREQLHAGHPGHPLIGDDRRRAGPAPRSRAPPRRRSPRTRASAPRGSRAAPVRLCGSSSTSSTPPVRWLSIPICSTSAASALGSPSGSVRSSGPMSGPSIGDVRTIARSPPATRRHGNVSLSGDAGVRHPPWRPADDEVAPCSGVGVRPSSRPAPATCVGREGTPARRPLRRRGRPAGGIARRPHHACSQSTELA